MRRNQTKAIQNYQEHVAMLLCPEPVQLDQTFNTVHAVPQETPFPSPGEIGEWQCTVCSHWNNGSVDDGCTACN